MSDETSKSIARRLRDPAFANRYFVGHGIDIGAGDDCLIEHRDAFPQMLTCRDWDQKDGDAQFMRGVPGGDFDFVHSSHCLEHLVGPSEALANWIRILKPGGYLVCLVPDEDMYEQGVWPSTFNADHKHTFTIYKERSWSPASANVLGLCRWLSRDASVIKIESLHYTFDWTLPRQDQTLGRAEAAIEFILRKNA